MREDYDISELNPRKNPYSEKLNCSEKDELLEKEFNFDIELRMQEEQYVYE